MPSIWPNQCLLLLQQPADCTSVCDRVIIPATRSFRHSLVSLAPPPSTDLALARPNFLAKPSVPCTTSLHRSCPLNTVCLATASRLLHYLVVQTCPLTARSFHHHLSSLAPPPFTTTFHHRLSSLAPPPFTTAFPLLHHLLSQTLPFDYRRLLPQPPVSCTTSLHRPCPVHHLALCHSSRLYHLCTGQPLLLHEQPPCWQGTPPPFCHSLPSLAPSPVVDSAMWPRVTLALASTSSTSAIAKPFLLHEHSPCWHGTPPPFCHLCSCLIHPSLDTFLDQPCPMQPLLYDLCQLSCLMSNAPSS